MWIGARVVSDERWPALMSRAVAAEKLLKSEEARRKLRDAVDRAKKELEEIRSL